MTREEYLAQLEALLTGRVPAEELGRVLAYYRSYFDEAGPGGEAGVMEELGIDSFDVIVSNPPYIRTADIEELEPEVRDFEPRLALDGSYDGLHFYRRIAAEAGPYLQAGGSLYLEIGADEAEDVKKILEAAGFEEIRVIRDLADKDRVIRARKPCTED